MTRVCILKTDGTNCDAETGYAFALAGAAPETVHVNALRERRRALSDFGILVIPGGFSYGDDIVSGKILAIELMTFLRDALAEFVERGGLVLGICNGFQVLVRTGLLPLGRIGEMSATLTENDSGKFECRWVSLAVEKSPCVFTQGLEGRVIELPVAHGEGKYLLDAQATVESWRHKLVTVSYAADGKATVQHPANPNGSPNGVAGVCDPTGRIFGLMPHPERFVERWQHPNWRGRPDLAEPHGLAIFENAVRALR